MDMKDPMPNAKAPIIVRKVESHKDIVLLDVRCLLFYLLVFLYMLHEICVNVLYFV